MRKTMIMMTLALALIAGACAGDVTESDEYQDLEAELAAVEQELADTTAELEVASREPGADTARHDAALATVDLLRQILDDPESYGTKDDVVDLLASFATADAVMDDAVLGAVSYRQAWHNTLYGGAFDARIDVYETWASEDGSQGGVLWVWHGANAQDQPFELPGISLMEFDEDGLITYELVTYPYPDEYVRNAAVGSGTPTPSTGDTTG